MLTANSADLDWPANEVWEGILEYETGDTFIVGVVTVVIGFIQSALVLRSFSSAGDGPLFPLLRGRKTPNELQVPVYPSQTQARIEQGVQVVPNIPQSVHIESSLQEGATLAHPPQQYGADMPPPPAYDSGSKPLQHNAASTGPPPAYNSN